jgi:aspartokinase-like uncharacterized kinase
MRAGPLVDIVVKVGGGLLAHAHHFDAVLAALADAAAAGRVLIVPGGGPFADAVRHVDRQMGLSDDAAHWMAVLAMDQYAHLLASRLDSADLVSNTAGIAGAVGQGRLAVLAPMRWLQEADPVPHSWDVTSDSIAAWIAGTVGARRLVLVKPPGVVDRSVDSYFHRALPPDIGSPEIVPGDQIGVLRRCLTI